MQTVQNSAPLDRRKLRKRKVAKLRVLRTELRGEIARDLTPKDERVRANAGMEVNSAQIFDPNGASEFFQTFAFQSGVNRLPRVKSSAG
jgi:hypothetical protein